MSSPTILLASKEQLPQLGLGTWQLSGKTCQQQVKDALLLGYTHIDTAEWYGNEAEIGAAIKGVDRSTLFITSKVAPHHLSHDGIIKSCERSLQKLGTDYLDLYLIHWPRKKRHTKDVLRAFKELFDQGKIKSFGVSNFTIHHLQDIKPIMEDLGVPISVNQVEYHPGLNQQALLNYCSEEGITLTAYSPIARGRAVKNDALEMIGQQHDKSAAQVALRWLVQKGIVIIPKTSSKEHAAENMAIFDFTLSKEEMEQIDALGSKERLINPPLIGDFNY